MKTQGSKDMIMRHAGIILLICVLLLGTALGQQKYAQTGAQFLSVASDARGGGLAEAMTSIEMNGASLFFNPAGMARMKNRVDLMASQNQWIADITHNSFSFAISPEAGRWGVIGASLMSVDYGDIQGTMVWANNQGFLDTEILKPTAFAAGIGYANALSDKFAVGGQIKYVGLNYGKSVYPDEDGLPDTVRTNLAYANAFDFGTIYRTGWKSLAFGMSVRNFSDEIKFEEEGFQLPLTFALGISMDLFDLISEEDTQDLLISIDALHYRSHPEQIKVGIEYKPLEMLALRGGYYSSTSEQDMTFGIGIQQFGLGIDYAYTPFGVWNEVHRLTARFSL